MYKLVIIAAVLGLCAARPWGFAPLDFASPLAPAVDVAIAAPAIPIAASALTTPAYRLTPIASPTIGLAPFSYPAPALTYTAPTYAAGYSYNYGLDYPSLLLKKR